MSRISLIFCLITIFLPIAPAYSQNHGDNLREEFRDGFIAGLRSERNIRDKILPFRLGAEKTEVVVRNMLIVVNDDAVANRIFEEFVASGMMKKFETNPRSLLANSELLQSLGNELFLMLGMKGLRRLDYQDLRIYLSVVGLIFDSMPPRVCRVLFTGDFSGEKERNVLGMLHIRSMSLKDTERFFAVYRRAALAEARDFPSVRKINESQRKIAEEAFGQIVLETLSSHPRGEWIATAFVNPNDASDKDLCEAGQVMINSLLAMKGIAAEWQTRVFIESIQ